MFTLTVSPLSFIESSFWLLLFGWFVASLAVIVGCSWTGWCLGCQRQLLALVMQWGVIVAAALIVILS